MMSEKRERITPGCVYREAGRVGMVTWVGRERDRINGKLEPACKIFWADGEHFLCWNLLVYEGMEFLGRYKVAHRRRQKNGVNLRFELEGAPLLFFFETPDSPAETLTQRIVQLWGERHGPEAKK